MRKAWLLPLLVLCAVTVPAPALAVGTCERDPDWGRVLVPQILDVVERTNAHRATRGLPSLEASRSLTRAALWKAAHMAAYGYVDHDDPAPPVQRTWDERVSDCGYEHGAGENIAAGYETPAEVMEAWLASEGHRDSIEGSANRAIGVGAVLADDGTIYWVQVFGTEDDSGGDSHSAPAAVSDDANAAEDQTVRIDVGANDTDADGDPVGVNSVGAPSHGTATLLAGGDVRYRPDPDFNGTDAFTYGLVDVFGLASTGEVTVTVAPANDPPVAANDSARVRPGRRVTVAVLANDSDVDGDALALRGIVSAPAHGSAVISGDTITYRARWGTGGTTDRLFYEVEDAEGATSRASLRIRIRRPS